MIKIKHTVLLFVLFFQFAAQSQSKKLSGNGTRLNIGPVVGFYSINPRHAVDPHQKLSGVFGFRREQRLDRSYKLFFLFGIDYLLHGLSFKSYYFTPDTLKLYDKSFAYDYSLLLHELGLPLQAKYLFKREDNFLFSTYVTVGYHFRYFLPARLKITENTRVVLEDDVELRFKSPLFGSRVNTFVSVAYGWQKNSLSSSRGSFFVELAYRYGFAPYYFEADYAPSSLFISSSHLALQLGLKF